MVPFSHNRHRLKGKGGASKNGGPPGDLYLKVDIAPHPDFKRDGDDLIVTKLLRQNYLDESILMQLSCSQILLMQWKKYKDARRTYQADPDNQKCDIRRRRKVGPMGLIANPIVGYMCVDAGNRACWS